MQRRKSRRHVNAARARWRMAIARAQEQRDAGIPDRAPADCRQPFELDLRSAGGRLWRIEPRLGYVSWRVIDADTGTVEHCAALKQALHWVADTTPRMLAARNYADC